MGILYAIALIGGILLILMIVAGIEGSVVESKDNKKMKQLKGFVPEKVYKKTVEGTIGGGAQSKYLAFDFTHSLFAFEHQLYSLNDVVTTELINDSTVVSVASAFQGGSIVPSVGAFAGGAQMHSGEKSALIAVRVTLDNPRTPSATIPFLFGVVDKASKEYQKAATSAYEVYSTFESIIRQNQRSQSVQNTPKSSPRAAKAPQPQNGDVLYCGQCGAKSTGKNKFCSQCGSALGK
jgi:hypothetical protein